MFPKKTVVKNFMASFLGERTVSPFYEKVFNTFNKELIYNYPVTTKADTLFIIEDVPDYLQVELPETFNDLKLKKVSLYDGYLIDFTKYKNLDEYLNQHFGKTSRSKLRRYVNRLELCFEVTYKMYYGHIDKKSYDFLFQEFKYMLNRRFDQKQECNYELQHWDEFHELTYELILEKKASLFVIYNGEKPINICMNMVYDKILFSNVSCYDIDYSAFNLGTIDMLKHIEWCYDNGFEVMDLLKGYLYYKKRWINHCYKYQFHYIYLSRDKLATVIATVKRLKTGTYFTILNFLKKWNVHIWYRNLLKYKYRKTKVNKNQKVFKIQTHEPSENCSNLSNKTKINLEADGFSYLRKVVFDFLYSKHESYRDTKVFRFNKNTNEFLIKGKNHCQLIECKTIEG
ncbi:GNAT family N-acetyltransferase [Flagellimonas sp. HMM57]|uniref:GNAT family N-acetyltransferase n=1 Tax=unclassified Flagellimonas TaxID=2644544 RepID=UPI0013CF5B46|nr:MULTISPECIES: GNAT family N-acetyltransferase [unclassified Flagellimonas]UII76135.1 GNAT family N-acetyltransferase [Flagellimonas sp. HMM57]